jgi:hypothetical protein
MAHVALELMSVSSTELRVIGIRFLRFYLTGVDGKVMYISRSKLLSCFDLSHSSG